VKVLLKFLINLIKRNKYHLLKDGDLYCIKKDILVLKDSKIKIRNLTKYDNHISYMEDYQHKGISETLVVSLASLKYYKTDFKKEILGLRKKAIRAKKMKKIFRKI